MKNVIASPLALVLACAVSVPAQTAGRQDPRQAQQPAVTFKTGVDLVAVDVTVVDRDGRPVRDLTPEDFTLTVDGKPRRLASVQFIAQTAELAPVEPPLTEFVGTNAATPPGRLITLVIDQNHIRAGGGKTMIRAVSRFIDTLNRSDRVGLTVIPGGALQVAFTANHALVKTLLANVAGRQTRDVGLMHVGVSEAIEYAAFDSRQAFNQMVERECAGLQVTDPRYEVCLNNIRTEAMRVMSMTRGRTEESLLGLRQVLGRLALAGPEPKTVVFVSEGLFLENPTAQLSWVGPIAASARASLYVLRLDSTLFDASEIRLAATANQDQILEAQGLDMLAGMARGVSLPVGGDAELAFRRLALELSGYYLLSFEPQGADRDGKPHDIKVALRRRGLAVRARRSFRVDPERAALTAEDLLSETLRSPLLATDVPLQVTSYTFRDQTSDKLKVLIAAEIERRLNPTGDFSLAFVLIDANNKVAASQFEQTLGTPAPGLEGQAQAWSGAALVDPGVYTLKLAVLGADGRRGSVEYSFRAQVQSAGQLRLGDLMLAQVAPGAAPRVRPLVGPNVTRDSVYGYLELYSEVADQLEHASVAFEIATDPNGRALESGTGRLGPVEGRTRTAEGSVPVALLPPGSYVARAVVSVEGRPVAHVTRPFALTRELVPAAGVTPGSPPEASSAALSAAAGPFHRASVLAPHVVGFFLDRLFTPETAASAAALRPAIEEARAGRFEAAAAALDGLDPDLSGRLAPTFLRGVTLLAQGQLEDAAGRFRESIRISSEFFPAAFYLGACYAAGGRDREAVGAWQTALVTEREAPFIYTLLGDALLRLDEGLNAIEIAREARQLWPDNDDILALEGAALAALGQGRDALAIFDAYLQRHPGDHERLFLAMRLLYETIAVGRSIATPEDDRARFARYAKAYAAANGPQQALVEEWRKFIEEKKDAEAPGFRLRASDVSRLSRCLRAGHVRSQRDGVTGPKPEAQRLTSEIRSPEPTCCRSSRPCARTRRGPRAPRRAARP